MNSKKLASELVKIAKELASGNFDWGFEYYNGSKLKSEKGWKSGDEVVRYIYGERLQGKDELKVFDPKGNMYELNGKKLVKIAKELVSGRY
jgi:hypothetical protein